MPLTTSRKKLSTTVALMLGMLLAPLAPATAATVDSSTQTQTGATASSSLEQYSSQGEATPQAGIIKGGKVLLKSLSTLLRSGQADTVIKKLPGLDDAAKNTIRTNKDGVANALDDVLKYADLPENAVREKLFYALSANGIGYGDAQVIADAVAGAVGLLI